MLLIFGLLGYAHGATTTVTGTINDLTGAAVTSGQVTFELKPGLDTTISGSARFVPSTVTCYINGSGVIKGDIAFATSCVVVQNTSLTPSGTYYLVCLWPSNTKTSCFNWYALASSFDITTAVPTPATSPAFTFADLVSNQTIGGNKTASGSWTFTPEVTFTGGLNAAYVKSQSTPSTTGFGRYGQGDALKFRNALNNADLNGLSMSSNVLAVGDSAGISTTGPAVIGGAVTAAGNITATSAIMTAHTFTTDGTPATSGAIRIATANFIKARNAANSGDVKLLTSNASDVVEVGDTAGVKIVAFPDGNFAGGNAPKTALVTSTYTNATTTFSDVTGLSWAISASTNYTLNCQIMWQGSVNTAGPKFQLTGPASPTNTMITLSSAVTATTSIYAGNGGAAFSTPVANTGTVTATTNFPAAVVAGILNGANAGTLKLQAAANGVGTLSIQAGSLCVLQ